MIVNIEGTIMFVTESIAELVGPHIVSLSILIEFLLTVCPRAFSIHPYQVDVVGQTVGDLVHTEDEEQICHALDLHSLGRQNFFVIRMKKTMAPTVRSREKVEYKVSTALPTDIEFCVLSPVYVLEIVADMKSAILARCFQVQKFVSSSD